MGGVVKFLLGHEITLPSIVSGRRKTRWSLLLTTDRKVEQLKITKLREDGKK
jgi:hypothetical protein